MKHQLVLAIAAVMVATSSAHAQFGSGIVFDPTQSAHAVQQIAQANHLYTTTVATTQNVIAAYNLARRMAGLPQTLYTSYSNLGRQQWTTLTTPANTYGNSSVWIKAASTGYGATAATQSASIYASGRIAGYGSLSPEGQREIAAQGATVDLANAVNSSDLETIGAIRAASAQRETDISQLEEASHSADPSQHTEMATLQRINQALLIELRSQQETNQILEAQALQQMVGQKVQQDNLKSLFQTGSGYQQTFNEVTPQQTRAGTRWAFHSCLECPKRTGHNVLLFSEIGKTHPDSCSDPKCYQAKLDAFVQQAIAAEPKLVQISTAYGTPKDGSAVIPRNKYVEIRQEKPKNKYQQDAPEFKTCKHMSEAIVTEGSEKGETKRVCANPDCPIHHRKRQQQRNHADAAFKAEQEKRRREEALAQATGLRVLKAIGEAVPVRLMKRDLLFVTERLTAMLDERKLAVLIRQHGIGKPKGTEAPTKLLSAFIRKADESKLGRILVETAILLSMHNQTDAAKSLREAAQVYKVDVDAITATVKQEFAAKEKAKAANKANPKSPIKPQQNAAKKAAAA